MTHRDRDEDKYQPETWISAEDVANWIKSGCCDPLCPFERKATLLQNQLNSMPMLDHPELPKDQIVTVQFLLQMILYNQYCNTQISLAGQIRHLRMEGRIIKLEQQAFHSGVRHS